MSSPLHDFGDEGINIPSSFKEKKKEREEKDNKYVGTIQIRDTNSDMLTNYKDPEIEILKEKVNDLKWLIAPLYALIIILFIFVVTISLHVQW